MNVLSLCDGMSCGQIALNNCNIPIDNYFASEIKSIAIKVTQENFPNTIQIGDVNKISYKDGVLYTEKGEYNIKFDLVMFGSPCQTFSIACKTDKRTGLENKEKSGLFLECYRILKEVNPKYFFVENVASMKEEDKNIISNYLGIEPIKLNTLNYGPVRRERLYWTNIPYSEISHDFLYFNDILDNGYSPRKIGRALMSRQCAPLTTPIRMFYRDNITGFDNLIFKNAQHYNECFNYFYSKYNKKTKAKELDIEDENNVIFEGVRYLNQEEIERCHYIPQGYTKCLTRNEAMNIVGDGWFIPIIENFFRNLKED